MIAVGAGEGTVAVRLPSVYFISVQIYFLAGTGKKNSPPPTQAYFSADCTHRRRSLANLYSACHAADSTQAIAHTSSHPMV